MAKSLKSKIPLTPAQRDYVRAHYRRVSDGRLSRVVGLNKAEVRRILKRLGLARGAEDEAWIKQHANEPVPEYTGVLMPEEAPPEWTRRDWICIAVSFVAAMIIYLLTLPPTITGEDAGELIVAAYSLGVPHPPGYPLWTLLAHLFTYVPIGSVAWRVAFASAFFGGVTAAFVYAIGRQLRVPALASLAGALALAFSQQFWAQSIIAEVYTLNALLIAVCFLAALRWYATHRARWLYVLAVAFGLGLCNHHTVALLAPVFIAFLLFIDREPLRRAKTYAACIGASLLMLSLYAYLPIRSAADPPVDWGDPENLGNFIDVVSRKQYAFAFQQDARTPVRFAQQTLHFFRIYAVQFTPILAWLPLLGAWRIWKHDRNLALLLFVAFAFLSFGFVLLTNFDTTRVDLWVNSVFWLPAYLVAALLLGLGVEQCSRMLKAPRFQQALTAVLLTACVALPIAWHYRANDKSDYTFARDYAENVLRTLEPDALYFPTADHATFPIMYLQEIEGMRPDVTIANKYGYVEFDLYTDLDPAIRSTFRKIPTDAQDEYVEHWIVDNTDRPAYFTKKPTPPPDSGWKVFDDGLIYRMLREDEAPPERDPWETYTWRTISPEDARGELSAEMIVSDYYFALGRKHLAAGEQDEAQEAFDSVLDIAGDDKETLNNIGSAAAEAGLFEAAEQYYTRAIEVDADYATGLRNLARVFMQQDKYQAALVVFDRLIKVGDADWESLWLSASCMRDLGRTQDALQRLDSLLRIPGDHARAHKEMGMIYLNEYQDAATAHAHFRESLALDPDQPDLLLLLRDSPNQDPRSNQPQLPQMPQLPGLPEGLPSNVPGLPQLPNPGGQLPQSP